jgi:hypothetical protein
VKSNNPVNQIAAENSNMDLRKVVIFGILQ